MERYIIYGARSNKVSEMVFFDLQSQYGFLLQDEENFHLVDEEFLFKILMEPTVVLLESTGSTV